MSKYFTEDTAKKIILSILKGENYRVEVINIIDANFLEYSLNFFKKVIEAKLHLKKIGIEWFKNEFLDEKLETSELAIHSGLNKKTIENICGTTRRDVVVDFTNDHFDKLFETINELTKIDDEIMLNLTIKLNNVCVDLDINESLIVINTLAVKRAEIRGSLWSIAGKRVEYPLMSTLCNLFGVEKDFFRRGDQGKQKGKTSREVDFYLVDNSKKDLKCEVKLMGKGNPESADGVFARDSDIFIAYKLSQSKKNQLSEKNISWVELSSGDGLIQFKKVLEEHKVPHTKKTSNFTNKDFINIIEKTFNEI